MKEIISKKVLAFQHAEFGIEESCRGGETASRQRRKVYDVENVFQFSIVPAANAEIAQPPRGSKCCFKRQFDPIVCREHREGFQLKLKHSPPVEQRWLIWRAPIARDDHVQEHR